MATEPARHSRLRSVYTPTPLFRLGAALFVLAALWLGSEVYRKPQTALGVFFAGILIISMGMALGAFARAEFDGHTLTYRLPLRPTRRIDRSQIESVEVSGRRIRALVIGYYPRTASGIVAHDRLQFLNMVPLQDQDELYELLGGVPPGD